MDSLRKLLMVTPGEIFTIMLQTGTASIIASNGLLIIFMKPEENC